MGRIGRAKGGAGCGRRSSAWRSCRGGGLGGGVYNGASMYECGGEGMDWGSLGSLTLMGCTSSGPGGKKPKGWLDGLEARKGPYHSDHRHEAPSLLSMYTLHIITTQSRPTGRSRGTFSAIESLFLDVNVFYGAQRPIHILPQPDRVSSRTLLACWCWRLTSAILFGASERRVSVLSIWRTLLFSLGAERERIVLSMSASVSVSVSVCECNEYFLYTGWEKEF